MGGGRRPLDRGRTAGQRQLRKGEDIESRRDTTPLPRVVIFKVAKATKQGGKATIGEKGRRVWKVGRRAFICSTHPESECQGLRPQPLNVDSEYRVLGI